MGELEVRGPWVAVGVLPGDVAADRWTEDGWFRTGDIVTIAPTGCVTIQDRAKDLVKSGGEWISTVALESALIGHPSVSEVVVVAVPHPQWGERPLAVIVPAAGCAPTIEDLRAHLAPAFREVVAARCGGLRRAPAEDRHRQVPEARSARDVPRAPVGRSVVNHRDTKSQRRTEILLGFPKKKLRASSCLFSVI